MTRNNVREGSQNPSGIRSPVPIQRDQRSAPLTLRGSWLLSFCGRSSANRPTAGSPCRRARSAGLQGARRAASGVAEGYAAAGLRSGSLGAPGCVTVSGGLATRCRRRPDRASRRLTEYGLVALDGGATPKAAEASPSPLPKGSALGRGVARGRLSRGLGSNTPSKPASIALCSPISLVISHLMAPAALRRSR